MLSECDHEGPRQLLLNLMLIDLDESEAAYLRVMSWTNSLILADGSSGSALTRAVLKGQSR